MAIRLFEGEDHVKDYAKYRPAYPDQVIEEIMSFLIRSESLEYHLNNSTAIDVGCATGHQSTRQVKKYFKKVIGVDVSPAMIKFAKEANHDPGIDFRVSPAEELPVEDNSIALVTAAAALHLFDLPKFYAEVDRVLIPGGVFAGISWGPDLFVADHPNAVELARIINEELREEMIQKGNPRTEYIKNRFMDNEIQVPYTDRTRRDNINISIPTTIKGYFYDKFLTWAAPRKMLEANPESFKKWHNDIVSKFLKAYGSTDTNAPLHLQREVFMIMGRKPK